MYVEKATWSEAIDKMMVGNVLEQLTRSWGFGFRSERGAESFPGQFRLHPLFPFYYYFVAVVART